MDSELVSADAPVGHRSWDACLPAWWLKPQALADSSQPSALTETRVCLRPQLLTCTHSGQWWAGNRPQAQALLACSGSCSSFVDQSLQVNTDSSVDTI